MDPLKLSLIVPSSILLAGLVDDLRSKKVHNKLVIALVIGALVFQAGLYGWSGIQQGALSGLLAIALMFPLYISKVVGGGDLKLMVPFGLATAPMAVFWVIMYSIFWGALLGVIQALLKGQGLQLLKNTIKISVTKLKDMDSTKLHKIPYTVALFFGWLTYLSLSMGGLQ